MLKSHHGLLATVTIAALSLGGVSAVAETPSNTTDLNTYLCKDVLRTSGEDRVIALALLHGYQLGKKNTTLFETGVLSRQSDDYIEYCLDHPSEKALQAFEKITK